MVRRLILEYYRLRGARVEEAGDAVRVVFSAHSPAELVGGGKPSENELWLAFDAQTAAKFSHCELVVPGSYRLYQVISELRARVETARGYSHLPPAASAWGSFLAHQLAQVREQAKVELTPVREGIFYEPYLVISFALAFWGLERRDDLFSVGVNLTSGCVWLDFWDLVPPSSLQNEALPDWPTARRRISYRTAYRLALEECLRKIAGSDPSWALDSLQKLQKEEALLRKHWEQLAQEARGRAEEERLAESYEAHLAEVRWRFSPRVWVRPAAAALVYLPVREALFRFPEGRERRFVLSLLSTSNGIGSGA